MSRLLRPLLLGGAVLLLVLGLACGGDEEVVTSDVVSTILWQADETLQYVVQDGDGDPVGQVALSVALDGDNTRLSQSFSSETNRDESVVLVDSETLKPISARRVITSPDDEVTLEVTYTEDGALIRQGDKQSGLTVPPHSYDNDTSLFLWRTLPFAEGYSASYVTIIANHRNPETVTVRVLGRESVTVPAGTFEAWKLEIRAGGVRQLAWYADTPARPLVRYDNSRGLFYELTSLTAPPA